MARKPNPNGTAYLKRQVRELVAVNEALGVRLATSVNEGLSAITKLQNGRIEAERKIDVLTNERDDAIQRRQISATMATEAIADRDALELRCREHDETMEQVKRIIDEQREAVLEARALAERMRQAAFPRFPWEPQSE